jgi:thioredoxin 1
MIDIEESQFKDAVANGITVVDFWAEWCGPCKMLTPILEELDSEMDGVKFIKVDADANSDLAAALGVASIPSVFIFKDGEPVANQIGAKPKALMRKFIESVL